MSRAAVEVEMAGGPRPLTAKAPHLTPLRVSARSLPCMPTPNLIVLPLPVVDLLSNMLLVLSQTSRHLQHIASSSEEPQGSIRIN